MGRGCIGSAAQGIGSGGDQGIEKYGVFIVEEGSLGNRGGGLHEET